MNTRVGCFPKAHNGEPDWFSVLAALGSQGDQSRRRHLGTLSSQSYNLAHSGSR